MCLELLFCNSACPTSMVHAANAGFGSIALPLGTRSSGNGCLEPFQSRRNRGSVHSFPRVCFSHCWALLCDVLSPTTFKSVDVGVSDVFVIVLLTFSPAQQSSRNQRSDCTLELPIAASYHVVYRKFVLSYIDYVNIAYGCFVRAYDKFLSIVRLEVRERCAFQ